MGNSVALGREAEECLGLRHRGATRGADAPLTRTPPLTTTTASPPEIGAPPIVRAWPPSEILSRTPSPRTPSPKSEAMTPTSPAARETKICESIVIVVGELEELCSPYTPASPRRPRVDCSFSSPRSLHEEWRTLAARDARELERDAYTSPTPISPLPAALPKTKTKTTKSPSVAELWSSWCIAACCECVNDTTMSS